MSKTVSIEIPAALFSVEQFGIYLNEKTIENLFKEIAKKAELEKDKKYVVNMQLDMCFIDPEEKIMKGGY